MTKIICRCCGFHNLEKDCKKVSSIAIDIFETKKTFGEIFTLLFSYNIMQEEPQAFCIICSEAMLASFWLKIKVDQTQKMLERDGPESLGTTEHLTQVTLLEFSGTANETQNGATEQQNVTQSQQPPVEKKIIRVADRANKYICSPCSQWFISEVEVRSHATIFHSPINVDNGQKLCSVCLKIVRSILFLLFYQKLTYYNFYSSQT